MRWVYAYSGAKDGPSGTHTDRADPSGTGALGEDIRVHHREERCRGGNTPHGLL